MAGSRKGERRGAAGRKSSDSAFVKKLFPNQKGMAKVPGSGRKKGSLNMANRPPPVDAIGVTLPHNGSKHRPTKSTEQYYADVAAVVHGVDARDRGPREVLLKTMRYFDDQAEEWLGLARLQLSKLGECKTPEDYAAFDVAYEGFERRAQQFMLTAVDVATRVIPYTNARLSAMQVTGANEGPIEVLGVLLQEIDQASRGRPTWAPPDLKLVGNG